MFTGPVGCGKSLLLSAIAGQVKVAVGTIGVSSKEVAYCSQRPWIRNATIRENITGRNSFNSRLYRQVLYICALEDDLDQLPLGDRTLCGSDGCRLSGGQKSRIVSLLLIFSVN